MKDIFEDLQNLRYSELIDKKFRIDEITCSVRYTQRGIVLLFGNKGYTIICNIDNHIRIICAKNDKTNDWSIPYKCEDKNEFFQLSTKYDYHNMSYEDLYNFQNLCGDMIKRNLNEG